MVPSVAAASVEDCLTIAARLSAASAAAVAGFEGLRREIDGSRTLLSEAVQVNS